MINFKWIGLEKFYFLCFNHCLYSVSFCTTFRCTAKWPENHALCCPKHSVSPIPNYFHIIDYIPHATIWTSVAILQLPFCTAWSLHLFHPAPQTPSLWQLSVSSHYPWVYFYFVYFIHKTPQVSEIIWYLSISVWLISLCIIYSRT